MRSEAETNSVRVLTWNIHGGVGPDGVHDLSRVVDLIGRHDPDIIAFQEIDSRGRPMSEGPLAFLTTALGSHSAEARTIITHDGHYGHALISRWPIRDVHMHDLSAIGRESRQAIEATVETSCGDLHVVATHLGLNLFERRRQAKLLSGLAMRGRVSVMLGDFNDWIQDSVLRREMRKVMPGRTFHRTFPARFPLFALDRIYSRPQGAMVESWTDREAKHISDHLPVIADIRMEW